MSYVESLFGLSDVRAVVTGGAGVLPSAMARALCRAGARVSLWDLAKSPSAAETAELMKQEIGDEAVVVGEMVDTTSEDAIAAAFDATEKAIGTPNLLVNGVGGNRGKGPFTEIDSELFKSVLHLNLLAGLVVPTKVFASRWTRDGVEGSIINIASMASYVPLSGVWAYDAAKSAVLSLTEASAKEFAPSGIRVNAIAPGFFIGNQNRDLLIANSATGELTPRGQDIINRTPYGRFGSIEELEGVVVYLASRAASCFVTGVCIPVDGGYLVDNI
jgi:NAD(P)-dependent dehydrogenase (short-subunit alcohol dehydrogenase family)